MSDFISEFTLEGVDRQTLKLKAKKSIDYPKTWVKVQIGERLVEVEVNKLLVAIKAISEM